MIFSIRTKTCLMKNLVHCIRKSNQLIRFESSIATRYPDYKIIYQFPLIRIASIVNRLKLYQTVATSVGIPVTATLAAFDSIATETALMFASSGIAWSLAFYAIGYFGQNQIGFVYLKNDETKVKISYADFWGRKVDTDIDVKDIWPLNDLPTTFNPLYYSLRRYSTKDKLKFTIKYGDIVEPEKFQLVFGDSGVTVKR